MIANQDHHLHLCDTDTENTSVLVNNLNISLLFRPDTFMVITFAGELRQALVYCVYWTQNPWAALTLNTVEPIFTVDEKKILSEKKNLPCSIFLWELVCDNIFIHTLVYLDWAYIHLIGQARLTVFCAFYFSNHKMLSWLIYEFKNSILIPWDTKPSPPCSVVILTSYLFLYSCSIITHALKP